MFSKIKEWFRKLLSNRKVVIGLILSVILLIAYIIFLFIQKPKPIGVDDNIELSDNVVLSRNHTQDVILADGSVKESGDQMYLLNVAVPPLEPDTPEFNQGESLFNNLIRSLESGTPEDINQGAALYEENRQNYGFTTPTNLITAAIGNDLLLLDEYNLSVDGVSRAGRGHFDSQLGEKVLKNFNSPISIALIGSRLLPVAHPQFVIDGESHVMDRFLYEPSWYESMYQYYPSDDFSSSTQSDKIAELLDRYAGKVISIYQVKLTSKYGVDVDVLIFEDGVGDLYTYGFYYTDEFYQKQTLAEYMDSEYSSFDNFTIDDLNWNNFQEGFNDIYNQTR